MQFMKLKLEKLFFFKNLFSLKIHENQGPGTNFSWHLLQCLWRKALIRMKNQNPHTSQGGCENQTSLKGPRKQ